MGDGCDMIIAQGNDRRFKATEIDEKYLGIDDPVDKQIEDYVELLWPIRDKILVIMDSNHHLEILKRTGTHPTRRIGFMLWGKEAEKKVFGYAGFLITRFTYSGNDKYSRTRSLTWYLSHGVTTGSRTLGGPKTSLSNVAKGRDADVFIFNHNHLPLVKCLENRRVCVE